MTYIFLDEIQNVASFEKAIDSLYVKDNTDVYITGSNSYPLSGELATLLTDLTLCVRKHSKPIKSGILLIWVLEIISCRERIMTWDFRLKILCILNFCEEGTKSISVNMRTARLILLHKKWDFNIFSGDCGYDK